MVKKVLVTGGAGYIGSILVRNLLDDGYEVKVMDKLLFGLKSLHGVLGHKNLHLIPGDIRNHRDVADALNEVDSVIHLAALVGDPSCAAQADESYEVNYISTARIAGIAKDKGIKSFVFASTCSVYGAMDGLLKEDSTDLNPQSWYAKTKILGEESLRGLQDRNFTPTILRLGTLYGLSPRLRFDLVVNFLTGKLAMGESAKIFGGEQFRPLVHVEDVADAFKLALECNNMRGDVFNVCSTNMKIRELGHELEKVFPTSTIEYIREMTDPRTYSVDNQKIWNHGFRPAKNVYDSMLKLKKHVMTLNLDIYSDEFHNHPPRRS